MESHIPGLEETRHLENFSVSDFLEMNFSSLNEKAKTFCETIINDCVQKGFLLREICGNIGKKPLVRNPKTKEIQEVLMLGSNNYLDLSQEPYIVERVIKAIHQFGVGCGGPQLLNGNTSLHMELEKRIAASKGTEAAILFSSGYSANIGWTNALLSANDWLVYDLQSHGSLYDSMKTQQFKTMPFSHNDVSSLGTRLNKIRNQDQNATVIVCVEGVYSMDGDIAPLDQIRKVCDQYQALLCIDDAHGSGVLGKYGHGTQEHFDLTGKIDLCMGTFSKSYCVTGGYVAGKRHLIDYMRINARSHLFSASLPPSTVAAVLAAIDFVDQHPERVQQLRSNAQFLAKLLAEAGLQAKTESAIIPVFIPSQFSIRDLIADLMDEGVFVNGIEYPSVPKNKQRLRLSMMATFTKEELIFAANKIIEVTRRHKILPSLN